MIGFLVVLAVLGLVALWVVVTYNSFIRSRNKVDEAWSGIDVQLKRRHDVVPNLVEVVKGYAAHERTTLGNVVEARAAAISASGRHAREEAEGRLSSALDGIRVVAEDYPELRASEGFQRLQAQLAELEDEIQASRRIYNGNVEDYNTLLQVFPNSLVAGRSFRPREFFRLETPAERAVPVVAFER
jgi:LemA protein